MSTSTGPGIMVAIGVLALSLAAITPIVSWAAEPVKQEKKAKKPAQGRTSALAPKATAPKIRHGRDCGKSSILFR